MYQNLDCEQIEMELMRVSREVSAVSGRQRDERTKDQIATGVGLVVFWPALFFLAKGDEKDRLARLKGEYEALEHVSLQQKCNIFPPT